MTGRNSRITEDDLKATEAMIAMSFNNLKASVRKGPENLLKPVTNPVRDHPFATIAAGIGLGLIIHEAIKIATPKVVVKKVPASSEAAPKAERHKRPDYMSEIIRMAMPYAVSYLQKELPRMLSGKKGQ
jgi:hypothetical protein